MIRWSGNIRILGFVLAMLLIGLAPASAMAGEPSSNASTGTVVAAALETAGYVSQARILANLKNMLEGMGGLIYLCCVFAALLTTALAGRYQAALWLLIGPPMFFFLIRADSSANGVEWRFGSFQDNGDLNKVMRGSGLGNIGGAKVSSVFHQYNVLISSLSQELINLITNKDIRHQMRFMGRQKVIDDLFGATISNPGLWQLSRFTFLQCHDELAAARMVSIGERDPEYKKTPQYKNAVREYCDRYPKRDKTLPRGPAYDYVMNLFVGLPLDTETRKLDQLSCEQLWQYMYLGSLHDAENDLRQSLLRHFNHQTPPDVIDRALQDIQRHLAEQHSDGTAPPPGFQCTNNAGTTNVAPTSTYHNIPVIFATWMIRKASGGGVMNGRQDQPIFGNSGLEPAALGRNGAFSANRAATSGIVQRFKMDQLGESAKYEVFILAKSLPYFQGAGLYMLGTLYPFFCLLVLLPGKAGGFLTWLALWAWLKMWDVGWALVYVADQLLWQIMPRRTYFRLGNGTTQANTDPVTVFEAAFTGDYSYSLTTYWVMLAGMMAAVPVLTAHAILGSKKAIAGVFLDSAKSIGSNFTKQASDWVAMEQLRDVDVQQFNRVFDRSRVPMERMARTLRNISSNLSAQAERDRGFAPTAALTRWLGDNAARLPEGMRFPVAPQGMQAPPAPAGDPATSNDLGVRLHHRLTQLVNGGRVEEATRALGIIHDYLNKGGRVDGGQEAFLKDLFGQDFKLDSYARGDIGGTGAMPGDLADFQSGLDNIEANQRNAQLMAGLSHFFRDMGDKLAGPAAGAVGANALLNAPGFRNLRFFQMMQGPLRAGAPVAIVGAGEMYRMSAATRILSLEMERGTNEASAQLLRFAKNHYYYEAMRSDEFAFFERLRGGITNRAEWWSISEGAAAGNARVSMDVGILNANLSALGQGWLNRADMIGIQGIINTGASVPGAIAPFTRGLIR